MKLWTALLAFACLAVGLAFPSPANRVPDPLPAFSGRAQTADLRAELTEQRIADLTPEGLSIKFYLTLSNVSPAPHSLIRYRYRAYVDESEYLEIDVPLDAPILVEPNGQTPIVLPLKITYANLFAAIPGVRSEDRAACLLTGELVFQDERRREKRVPFSLASDFPVFRGLDIHVLPIEAKSLTIGGADVVFRAAIMNPNGFGVTVGSFRYKLELAGKTVSEGVTAKGLEVDSRREKEFAVPLLLDFFELGREVHDALAQPPADVRIAGTVEMATPWGTFSVPLDKSDKAAVK
jgi:LEA14-like dessication related protein